MSQVLINYFLTSTAMSQSTLAEWHKLTYFVLTCRKIPIKSINQLCLLILFVIVELWPDHQRSIGRINLVPILMYYNTTGVGKFKLTTVFLNCFFAYHFRHLFIYLHHFIICHYTMSVVYLCL